MVYLSWAAGAARRRRSSCSPWKPTVKRCLRRTLKAPVLSLFLANCPAMINAIAVVGGRSRDKCVLLDVDGPKLPLKWEGVGEPVALGTRVTLRIFFRDATIFAVGSGRV